MIALCSFFLSFSRVLGRISFHGDCCISTLPAGIHELQIELDRQDNIEIDLFFATYNFAPEKILLGSRICSRPIPPSSLPATELSATTVLGRTTKKKKGRGTKKRKKTREIHVMRQREGLSTWGPIQSHNVLTRV
jgi:hypothetical protein